MSWLDAMKRRIGLARAYRSVFDGPEGQAVLSDLLRAAGMLECSHTPQDSHQTAFMEGRRSIGLHLMERLRWTEGELHKLAEQRTAERLGQEEDG